MHFANADLHRSLRKSRTRVAILLALLRHGELHLLLLAEVCQTTTWMVASAIEGNEPYFARDLGLRMLGLVAVRESGRGRCFRLTETGERVARGLARTSRARGAEPAHPRRKIKESS